MIARQIGILVGAMLLFGCSNDSAAVKLYTMDCGSITMSPNSLDNSDSFDPEERRYLPVPCYLIRHPRGDMMWDTGLPDGFKDHPVEGPDYKMWVQTTLKSQLDEIGVPPSDVEYLALSHSHLDHAGNADLFSSSVWLVSPAEVAFAKTDFAKHLGIVSPFDFRGIEHELVNQDNYDVFGDGSVLLVKTPGHTGGHMSLLVNLKNAGPLLFTGDLYHFRESRDKRLVPDFNYNVERTHASMDKFEALAEETGARVIIQHVPEDFESMPKVPAYLN